MVEAVARMRHQDLNGSFWNIEATATIGISSAAASNVWIRLAARLNSIFPAREQKPVVGLRAALQDRDVEPVFRVGAVGERLIKAAMLGFGEPVGRRR